MKYLILIIICLALTGCWLFPTPIPIVEPVTAIMIIPERSEIGMNESIELFCYDQLHRQVVAKWSKRCLAGVLSNDLGVSCIYTTPRTMTGIQEIYAEYNGLKATAKVKATK